MSKNTRPTMDDLRKLWDEFTDTPIDNNDRITAPFRHFPKGTDRFEIWMWFDDLCPNGVVADLAD